MCANNYQNLFKTFVANLCGGNFVSTFDKQRIDGVVTKAEFQEIMYLDETKKNFANFAGWNGNENNTTGYRDLVNSFWNSFDINQEDGKIKGTGLFNLNGLDNTESTGLQTDLNIHKKITDQLVSIQKYPNTYNYLLNQLVKELGNSELESLTPEKINETLNQVITNNSSVIKDILLKDVSNISLENYTNYNIQGFYKVEEDSTLTNLLTNSVSQPGDIASLDDITNYFNNSTNSKEINEYFNSKTYSSDNNYQKALMQKNIYDEINNYINKSLSSLKNSSANYDETIKNEVRNYINSYNAENGVNLDDLIAEIKTKFFATDENGNSKGQALYDYLYTLSLCDLKEENNVPDKIKDAEGNEMPTFERHLYNLIGGKDGFGSDATKIIKWLTKNDMDNSAYQNLIQEIAKEILENGKNLTASEIHTLIYNKLGVKSTDGILSQEQIDEILGNETVELEPELQPEPEVTLNSIINTPENIVANGYIGSYSDPLGMGVAFNSLNITLTTMVDSASNDFDKVKLQNAANKIRFLFEAAKQLLEAEVANNSYTILCQSSDFRGGGDDENMASFTTRKNQQEMTQEEFWNEKNSISSNHLITISFWHNSNQDINSRVYKTQINGAYLKNLFIKFYNEM